MNGKAWTEEAHALLEMMAQDGATGSEIAKTLGITRNAVLGRCHRKGVFLGADRRPSARPPQQRGETKRRGIPDAQKLLALSAYYAGCRSGQAAALVGASKVALYSWLKTYPALCARARGIAFTATGGKAPLTSGASRRGFGSMPKDRLREIAAKGGAAVPAAKRSFSTDREHAQASGRRGGLARGVGHGFS